jgi:hypothetical protein
MRHQRDGIDLSHLEAIVREAQLVRLEDDDHIIAWRQHP